MMTNRETAQQISDRATDWVARMDRDGDNPDLRAELDAWLAGDERREGAYFRALSAWSMLDRASVLGAGGPAETEEIPSTRYRWRTAIAAACLVLFLSVSTFLFLGREADHPYPVTRIATGVGEIRRVPLDDGSVAAVNTDSALEVTMQPELRRVDLAQGEAWFQVAKNAERPFVVDAGNVRIRAVGTAFSVHRTAEGVGVQVTEGTVELWRRGDRANSQRASAGMRAFVSDTVTPQPVAAPVGDIDRALAWRVGELEFNGDTLQEAAAQFNRHNSIKIEIADPRLADEPIVGRFRTNEAEAFVRSAATLLDARVISRNDRVILTSK